MALKSDHRENIEECKSIFVSWIWVVSFFVVTLGGFATTIATYYINKSGQDIVISVNCKDIEELKIKMNKYEKIENDIDTIKIQNQKIIGFFTKR